MSSSFKKSKNKNNVADRNHKMKNVIAIYHKPKQVVKNKKSS